jgi:hypothetical protein
MIIPADTKQNLSSNELLCGTHPIRGLNFPGLGFQTLMALGMAQSTPGACEVG